ncbi:MAG: hypothetical protein RL434_845 [Pseudomonadota bacterium]|jgi:2-aminomuconate deaminase
MTGKVLEDRASPRGKYPHVKCVGDLIFVSGTSARQRDNSIRGATVDAMGTTRLDVREQTRAVLENIAGILESVGASLAEVVSVTTYLVDMNDFGGYNEVYGEFFDYSGPARTTVAVHQLPHPLLRIEISCIAHRAATREA